MNVVLFSGVVLRSVQAGGNLNNGVNAGVAARNANNDLGNSNTNNGSQLSYFVTDRRTKPWHLPKHKNLDGVLVGKTKTLC